MRKVAVLGVLLGALVVLSACGTAAVDDSREAGSGLELTGDVDGARVTVNDGAPELVVGDCSPRFGPGTDVCAISRAVGGEVFVLSIENPEVLEVGDTLDVAASDCRGPTCDDVTEHAVIDVQLGANDRVRAQGGTLRVDVVEEFRRYAGRLRLELPDGRLSGSFDLVPLPDDRGRPPDPDQADPDQADPDQADPDQADPDQADPDQADPSDPADPREQDEPPEAPDGEGQGDDSPPEAPSEPGEPVPEPDDG
ncbi:hypothetical protein ER308_17615 [Egibacter rhizosphaerae]|uniref:DUF5666 domain-containing protein n=1 Tax=Egibacter rhizosphaerae TaxID=1670831 RepID=A0A411YJ31_9ACTN|nr:hypothetical protein [Egibacter rhizosphaerae]QBI21207.1 hypothetical protein ER308_17615 [Egibacter rhizosphaerae]